MYTMMQVCRELDMTYQTLKFYCNGDLFPMSSVMETTAVFLTKRMLSGLKTLSA